MGESLPSSTPNPLITSVTPESLPPVAHAAVAQFITTAFLSLAGHRGLIACHPASCLHFACAIAILKRDVQTIHDETWVIQTVVFRKPTLQLFSSSEYIGSSDGYHEAQLQGVTRQKDDVDDYGTCFISPLHRHIRQTDSSPYVAGHSEQSCSKINEF